MRLWSDNEIRKELRNIEDDYIKTVEDALPPIPDTAKVVGCVEDPKLRKIFALMVLYANIAEGGGPMLDKALASAKMSILDGNFWIGVLRQFPDVSSKDATIGKNWSIIQIKKKSFPEFGCIMIDNGAGSLWN